MLRKALDLVSDADNMRSDRWKISKRYGLVVGVLHGLDTYVDYYNLIFNPQSEYL